MSNVIQKRDELSKLGIEGETLYNAIASALGISVEDVKKELANGNSTQTNTSLEAFKSLYETIVPVSDKEAFSAKVQAMQARATMLALNTPELDKVYTVIGLAERKGRNGLYSVLLMQDNSDAKVKPFTTAVCKFLPSNKDTFKVLAIEAKGLQIEKLIVE